MYKRRLRNARPKEIFGEAIIAASNLAAAGISGGFALKAARDQANATKAAAQQQAAAIQQSAEANSQAIRRSNEIAKELQEQELDLTRENHSDEMQAQKDLQMSILALNKQDSDNMAKQEANAMLKRGGRIRLRNLNGVKITDGGYALPLGNTPYGGLYELRGDNHEQSHKVGNTRKTGVGVKVGNKEVEGEGNGSSSTGELILTTPNSAIFLSKHNINGFNPRNAVLSGMDPMLAYYMQEANKTDKQKQSKGRTKHPTGGATTSSNSFWPNYGGSTISGIGNLLGALTGGIFGHFAGKRLAKAQKRASQMLNDAYLASGNMMAEAYGNLRGIDPSYLKYEDFASEGYVPSLRTAHYNISPIINTINRGTNSVQKAISESNLSGVAKLNRLRDVQARANEQASATYAEQENKEQEIYDKNIEARNNAAALNAQLRNYARGQYMKYRTDVAKYNADIANQRVLGIANARSTALNQGTEALSNGILGAAQARADALSNFGTLLGNAFSSTGNTFGTRMNSLRDNEFTMRLMDRMYQNRGDVNAGFTRSETPTYTDSQIQQFENYRTSPDGPFRLTGNLEIDEAIRKYAASVGSYAY